MAYESFAQVYDQFMEDTPYDSWTEYLKEIFKKHNLIHSTNIIADLGCGTGNMTERLAENGFDMIISNGQRPEDLYDIIEGASVGTLFKSNNKRWFLSDNR